jgi:hypothetical protein
MKEQRPSWEEAPGKQAPGKQAPGKQAPGEASGAAG